MAVVCAGVALAFGVNGGSSPAPPMELQRGRVDESAGPDHPGRAPQSVSASLPDRRGARRTAIPILMYHVVADPPAGAPYPELYVRPGDFARQMEWLASHGYVAVRLEAVLRNWRSRDPLPPRAVVVSFDDGYRSVWLNAFPVLRRKNWPGLLNLEVRNLEQPWGIRPHQVEQLVAADWELGAHTLTHPSLTSVDDARLEREVVGSRDVIASRFGVNVLFFCYPAGAYDERVIRAVRRAGFLAATTTEYGLARPSELMQLDRVRVSRSDGVAGFAAKVTALAKGL